MSQLIPTTRPLRVFKHRRAATVRDLAVFPDRQRMVTGSSSKAVRLWDLKKGVVSNKLEGHRDHVSKLAVSRDGQIIASGDMRGNIIAWHGQTGKSLTRRIKAHSITIRTLNFSPDGTVLVTGSVKGTILKLWSTRTWQLHGNPIQLHDAVWCIQYSPSGELLAIATSRNIEIYNPGTRERVANFEGHGKINFSLAWTPDGTRLLSGGDKEDPSIREWDAFTWKQVGDPWTGHSDNIISISIHPAGTLVASVSEDRRVHLWQLSDRQNIAIFQPSARVICATFSMDGKHVLSGGADQMVSEWEVPTHALPEETPKTLTSKAQDSDSKIPAITTTARKACIAGDLSEAEKILTQEIDADAYNNTSYANRSFVMARKLDWNHALQDAIKSLSIRRSLTGYIAKGIALFGKRQLWDATTAFDLASTFTNGDSKTSSFLFLIKVIALFNANKHEEAMLLVQELTARHNANPLASRIVEAHLRFQLGTIAVDGALHAEAIEHFTAAVKSGAFFATLDIHSMYEDFIVLFGWDLKTLWQVANQQRYHALHRAGEVAEALEAYRYMMDMSNECTKDVFLAWIKTLNKK